MVDCVAPGIGISVTVGPGASNATVHYGKLAATGAAAPTLEITYTK